MDTDDIIKAWEGTPEKATHRQRLALHKYEMPDYIVEMAEKSLASALLSVLRKIVEGPFKRLTPEQRKEKHRQRNQEYYWRNREAIWKRRAARKKALEKQNENT